MNEIKGFKPKNLKRGKPYAVFYFDREGCEGELVFNIPADACVIELMDVQTDLLHETEAFCKDCCLNFKAWYETKDGDKNG